MVATQFLVLHITINASFVPPALMPVGQLSLGQVSELSFRGSKATPPTSFEDCSVSLITNLLKPLV